MSEVKYRFSRSGGRGGQHVNKVSTRVELLFDVLGSGALDDVQKSAVLAKLKNRIGEDGVLSIVSDESRSQWKNREDALRRFQVLMLEALKRRKKRVATGATGVSKEKRLVAKKLRGRTKQLRGRVESSGEY